MARQQKLKKKLRSERDMIGTIKQLSVTIILPTIERFVAEDHFVVDTSNKAQLKILSLNENFKKLFLPKIENDVVPPSELIVNELVKYADDKEILGLLGGEWKAEITLGQFFSAFAAQSLTKDFPLCTKYGEQNSAYIRDVNGVVQVVIGFWCYGSNLKHGWGFAAVPKDPNPYLGARILSRCSPITDDAGCYCI